uniref:AlNc14C288G10199 protein n=1 Tax=Albugo laibachii Nc14 TaxID=890382 RepID=F0WV54_9STRA|nr:AlNc14C288G10199 [Albugo laibachii Nc14]|eukprot:CCA25293.1 AlNc14C288G10199 [Albugo laibachii Nc14]
MKLRIRKVPGSCRNRYDELAQLIVFMPFCRQVSFGPDRITRDPRNPDTLSAPGGLEIWIPPPLGRPPFSNGLAAADCVTGYSSVRVLEKYALYEQDVYAKPRLEKSGLLFSGTVCDFQKLKPKYCLKPKKIMAHHLKTRWMKKRIILCKAQPLFHQQSTEARRRINSIGEEEDISFSVEADTIRTTLSATTANPSQHCDRRCWRLEYRENDEETWQ